MTPKTLPFPLEDRYYRFGHFIKRKFGERIYKVSIDAGFTCPNRDGTKGTGGCIYCNNASFVPSYSDRREAITQQIERGIQSLQRKYKARHFFAYFQPYTNTYAPASVLENLYREALSHPAIVGLLIGTRADCIDEETWQLLQSLAKEHFISLEIGIESVYNRTLKWMNRGHNLSAVIEAVQRAKEAGLFVTGHIILGFPIETKKEMMNYTTLLNPLILDSLKIHHLHIVKGTKLAELYARTPFRLWDEEEYISFMADFLEKLDPRIIIQRIVGDVQGNQLIAPRWKHVKPWIIRKIVSTLEKRGSFQGFRFQDDNSIISFK